MKKNRFAIFILLLIMAIANVSSGFGIAQDRFYKELPITSVSKIVIVNHSGNIVINVKNTDTFNIAATRTVKDGDNKGCAEFLKNNPMDVKKEKEIILINSQMHHLTKFDYVADITITVPKKVKIEVMTRNGQIVYNSEDLPYLIAADSDIAMSIGNLTVVTSESSFSVTTTKPTVFSLGGMSLNPLVRWWKSLKNELPFQW